jgi:hypothetical protein
MYLFADRLSPAPANDAELAPLLMAVAAWSLREQGTIDLAPLPHPRPVDGHLGFNRKRRYEEQPGLEGGLLRSMTGRGKETRGVSVAGLLTIGLPMGFETEARPDSLRHAIESGPWQVRRPYRAVIGDCRHEARSAGAMGRVGRGLRPDAASRLEIAFSELRSRWDHFELRERDLWAALMTDCVAGLERADR